MYHKRRARESDPDDDDDDYNNKRKLRRRMMDAGIDSEIGWIAHEEESNNEHHIFPKLKFSPDGSFLISASVDGIVRLWKYNTNDDDDDDDDDDGYYQQLQECNIYHDIEVDKPDMNSSNINRISVSPCCRYVAFFHDNLILLKIFRTTEKQLNQWCCLMVIIMNILKELSSLMALMVTIPFLLVPGMKNSVNITSRFGVLSMLLTTTMMMMMMMMILILLLRIR